MVLHSQLLFFFFLLLFKLAFSQPRFLRHFCFNNGNFTSNATYQTNLNLLSSLPSNASVSGFFSASSGERPDRITAASLCRGDTGSETCRRCVNDSIVKLPQLCPLYKGAIGWYDNCMLKFSNETIPEATPAFYMRSPLKYSSAVSASQYNQALGELMLSLRTRASKGGSVRKYASGEANVTGFQRIYGLVQCTPDLTALSCSNCLETAANRIPDCCDGRDGGRVVRPSCNLRYEAYLFYTPEKPDAPPAASSPPTLNSTSPPPSSNSTTSWTGRGSNKTKTVIIVVVFVVLSVSVILVILIFFFLRQKKRWKEVEEGSKDDEIISAEVESLLYDFGTIRDATDNFSLSNRLGQGGFGAVYKGRLLNGQEIAVKRLSTGSAQGDLEFKNEVMLLAKLQHRNLVRLLGFSLQGKERLLIYEFLPKTSLDHFIFDPVKRLQLDWGKRHKIIGGVARGILYLHEDSRLRIIHRDLKAGNILLDEDMNPKIADFGMARLFIMDQTHAVTNNIAGTYGYMAPEYAMHGQFSGKSDVFSFGILVLEIVSGQKNNSFRNGEDIRDLVTYAWKNWRAGTALTLMDSTLSNYSREVLRCIHIALLCVQENVADRPNMASVVLMLNSESIALPVPSQPPFINSSVEERMLPVQGDSAVAQSDQSGRRSEAYSINGATMSITESDVYFR